MEKERRIVLENLKSGNGILYDVKLRRQIKDKLCWASVVESIAYYSGKNNELYSQDLLCDLEGNEEIDPFEYLSEIRDKDMYTCEKPSKLKIKDMKAFIQDENAPIVCATPYDKKCDEGLHYILIVGYITIDKIFYIITKDPLQKGKKKNEFVTCDITQFSTFKKNICGFIYSEFSQDFACKYCGHIDCDR